MNRYIQIIFCLLLSLGSQAKDLTLISTGEGQTKELAVRSALLEAVEQAYGSFISSNTMILNDELIKDELVNLRRGNIKKYNVLSEIKLGDSVSVTVESVVSTDKLTEFAVSKGSEAELAGAVFAMNLKLARLNLSNAVETLKQLYESLRLLAPIMYDYTIKVNEPIIWENRAGAYVPVSVYCSLNSNGVTFYKSFNQVREAIIKSLKSSPIGGISKEPEMDLINDYLDKIVDLTSAWCLGFVIIDNVGVRVKPVKNLNEFRSNCYSNYDILGNYRQRLQSNSFQESENRNMKLLGGAQRLRASNWNESDYGYVWGLTQNWYKGYHCNHTYIVSYINNLHYGLIEVPYNPECNAMWWFINRLGGRPRKGEVNGVVRFMMTYNIDTIERVSDIKVIPLGNAKK